VKRATELLAFDACPGDPFRPLATPIYQTATFDQPGALEPGLYDYSRSGNPTRAVLEAQLARLERGTRAVAFASGLAALTAVTRLLRPGDELVAGDDLYGGSYRLFSRLVAPHGVRVRYADLTDEAAAAAAITPRTRLVHVESMTNPLLRVPDLRKLAALAHGHGAWLCVDASILTPYLQRPLELGADIVVHSATKGLGGHGDLTAGSVAVADPGLAERIAFVQNAEGAGLGPFDAFLLLRGMQTLAVRMDRQQASAHRVASHLRARGLAVRYPGLPEDPGHARLRAQSRGAGAVLSFETGAVDASARLVDSLRLFSTSVSFGSIHSSASLPCRMSHAAIPVEVRRARRLPEDLVRLSIGLEDPDDLASDLEQALAAAGASAWGAGGRPDALRTLPAPHGAARPGCARPRAAGARRAR
jgi:cystathionine beta-lyase